MTVRPWRVMTGGVVPVLALVVSVLSLTLPTEDLGVQGILTTAGLKYMTDSIGPIIPQILYESSIPDITGDANGLHYSLYNMQFAYVNMPNIVAEWVNGVGVSAGTRDANMTLLFDYSFIYSNYPPFTFKGSDGQIAVVDLSIQVVCQINASDIGGQVLKVAGNSTNIGSIEISIGSSSFINLILGIMTPVLTNTLEDVLRALVSSIIEMVVNPSINMGVVCTMGIERKIDSGADNKIDTPDDTFEGIFRDNRLVEDPIFTDSMMMTRTTAKWYIARYNKCYGTCESDNQLPGTDIRFDSIIWDGNEVDFDDTGLPELTFNKENETSIKCDAWKSMWQVFLDWGYFNSSVTSGNGTTKIQATVPYICSPEKSDEVDPYGNHICYETVDFDTDLIGRYLTDFEVFFPSENYKVRIRYTIQPYTSKDGEKVGFEHETMYSGIYVKIPGQLVLETQENGASNWVEVISIQGYLELSENPCFLPGTDVIKLSFYYHGIHYENVVVNETYSRAGWYDPDTINTIEDVSDLNNATLMFVQYGIIPYLESWGVNYGLHTGMYEGYVLTDIEVMFDKNHNSVTLGGNITG